MDDALKQLVVAIQTMVPEVWAIYMRQILVELFQLGGLIILFSCIAVITIRYIRTLWEDIDDVSKMMLSLLISIWVITWASLVGDFIGKVINPEYYVIQKLLEVISGQ